ncbi:hypothetical protein [Methylocystis sp.]|uniref:hypothetical protein n=1 Tax=Methylocystis sp. TaxID=1911079 RepID=UPI003DA628EA
MIPEERISGKERIFEIFMGAAAVLGLLIPIAGSSADLCRGPLRFFSAAPTIQAFIKYKFLSAQEVCSFERLFLAYGITVIIGSMLIGRSMPQLLNRRAASNGKPPIKFWRDTIIVCSLILVGVALLFLIYQYEPYASNLDSIIVAKIWFSTKLSLCAGIWVIGFMCFHVLWSIFDDRDGRV